MKITYKKGQDEFGLIDDYGKINGLLGLDILLNMNANINLKNLTLTME